MNKPNCDESVFQDPAADGEETLDPDNPPPESLVPELTAQPAIEDEENIQKLKGAGAKQPCGRVVGVIRRHWRDKQYCGSLKLEGDRAVSTGKGQTTSALFVPVDRKARFITVISSRSTSCFFLLLYKTQP